MVKISSRAFIFLAIFPLNHAAPDDKSYWLNPPEGGAAPPQFTWMVGEQQNLSWFTLSRQTYNISLVQEVVPSSNDGVANVYGIIYFICLILLLILLHSKNGLTNMTCI
jgi:hypothetical protein